MRGLAFIRNYAEALLAASSLRRRARAVDSGEAALEFTRVSRSGTLEIPALQNTNEILPLLELVESENARAVVEIGSAQGGTLFMLARAAAADAIVVSIDLPWGEWGSGYPVSRTPLYRSFARRQQRVELRADSHDPRTLERLRRVLRGRPIDVLFIDGDHTYEGVKRDFVMYTPLVRSGGIVALHDIAHKADPRVGVHRVWAEIKQGASEAQEFVAEGSGKGIGVIRHIGREVESGSSARPCGVGAGADAQRG